MYKKLLKAGWPLQSIEEMDIAWFLRLSTDKKKTEKTNEKVFIDDLPL
jgi:hypothetical protein